MRPTEAPPPHSHALVIMAKAPLSGTVKSRLVPPLTADEAAALSECFIRDVCASVATAAAIVAASFSRAPAAPASAISGTRVAEMVAYSPVGMELAFEGLAPASFQLIAQRGADLTERLINVADDLFAAGYESVSMMNADSPTIPPAILVGAVTSLARPGDRIVIAGAADGGYCLIGLKRPHRRIFEGITWSTAAVFAQTLERAAELGLEVTRIPSWYDIDDAPSLRRLVAELFGYRTILRTSNESAASPIPPADIPRSSAPAPGLPGFSAPAPALPGFSAPATRAWLSAALAAGLARRLSL